MRLEALVDGVTAFALTLLVFDLRVPSGLDAGAFPGELVKLVRPLVAFAVSAAVIGSFWLGNLQIMNFVVRIDRTTIWIAIAGLSMIALLPFTTAFLQEYIDKTPWALAVYGANLAALAIVGASSWEYGTRGRRLVRADTPDEAIRDLRVRLYLGLAFSLLGVALAFVNVWASLAAYFVAFLPFALRGKHEDYLQHTS